MSKPSSDKSGLVSGELAAGESDGEEELTESA